MGPLYISKAIAPSSSFSFEKFTYYQIGALQHQGALGRAQWCASWSLENLEKSMNSFKIKKKRLLD